MSANTICWADIPVTELERAIGFYEAVLAQPVKRESMSGFEFGVLPHAESNASGCLVVMEDTPPSQAGPLIYLSVNGRLDAAVDAVKANGGQVLQEKHPLGPYGFRAVVVDSEGNRIALHSETE